MLDRFLEVIKNNQLFSTNDRLLVAVSGGIDSMTLCHLLSEAKFSFSVAHCNFKLRNEESDRDEQLVMDWCLERKITFYSQSFDTKSSAINNGISIQMAARDLRYRWFEQLIEEERYDFLLTAHNLNDSLETVLFNLAKGTGLKGLTGISEKLKNIVRPLLYFSREEIYEFGVQSGVKWREDTSNQDVKYHRNRIRNRVIPELKEINPSLLATYKNSYRRLKNVQDYLEQVLADKLKPFIDSRGDDVYILKEVITDITELDYLISPYGFSYGQANTIFTSLSGRPGKLFYSDNFCLNVDRKHLVISPLGQEFLEVQIDAGDRKVYNDQLSLEMSVSSSSDILRKPSQASLDFEKLEFPLTLRKWKQGDFFYPLGMSSKKKVSDYMIDSKIPLNLKNRIAVLESKGNIVWIVGHRIDNRYKVTADTRKLYHIIMK
ncbi:MAG: tRNA lysidine(34) synthetase TilS [Bacteroidota bacterium]